MKLQEYPQIYIPNFGTRKLKIINRITEWQKFLFNENSITPAD